MILFIIFDSNFEHIIAEEGKEMAEHIALKLNRSIQNRLAKRHFESRSLIGFLHCNPSLSPNILTKIDQALSDLDKRKVINNIN